MDSVLNEFEDDQALLLMYLADELPAAARRAVDRRLASDPALRSLLGELSAVESEIGDALEKLDAADPLPAPAVGMKRLVRAISQWQADRLRRQAEAPVAGLAARWSLGWLLPAGVAAAFLIGFIAWWGAQLEQQKISGAGGIAINSGLTDQSLLAPASQPGEDFAMDDLTPIAGLDGLGDLHDADLGTAESDLAVLAVFSSPADGE